MKTIITFFALLLSIGIANAQTEEQTLEWLNAKKIEVFSVYSLTVRGTDGKLEITKERIRAHSDDGAQSYYKWYEIKDIKENYSSIIVISNGTYNGKTSYIQFSILDNQLRGKYINALKHMATLKGAKLIDDDLF